VADPLPGRADVAVIGAGVMGCSLAFHLGQRRAGSIVVLDRGLIGQGTTAACAGGVRAQFSTEVNVRIGMEAKRMLRRFAQEVGFSADFRPIGYLFLLTTDEERATFADQVRRQRRVGLDDVRELTPAEAGRLVPGLRTQDLMGATFCPSDGLAGPNEVTSGYARAANAVGVRILEESAVIGFLLRGDRVEGIRTQAGEMMCGRVVICAGPWSGEVAAWASRSVPIVPSRRQAFVTEAFAGLHRSAPMTIDFHTSFYFHPEGEGVLFGMSDPAQPAGFGTSVDWTFLDRIGAVAARRWPPLLEARVRAGWAGLYEQTPDSQPLVGPFDAGGELWIAAGFSGHGFMMAPVIGKWLAEWMTGGAPTMDLTDFRPDRFAAGRLQPERYVV